MNTQLPRAPDVVDIAVVDGPTGGVVSIPVRHDPAPTVLIGPNGVGKTSALTAAAYYSMGAVGHALAGRVSSVAVEFADGSGCAVRRTEGSSELSAPFELFAQTATGERIVPGPRVYGEMVDVVVREALAPADELAWRVAFGKRSEGVRPDEGWLELAAQLPEWSVRLVGTARLGMPESRVVPSEPAELVPAALVGDTVLACRNDVRSRLSASGRSAGDVLGEIGESWVSSDGCEELEALFGYVDRFYDARRLAEFIDADAITALSAGEQHIFVLFHSVLLALPERTVILIDEPELSLQTAWCHPLLGELAEAAALHGSRIVAATHSAAILNEWWDHVVEVPSAAQSTEDGDGDGVE